MKIEELTFPMTKEDFVAYKEALSGRTMGYNRREADLAWLPFINESYAEGKTGDREALLLRLGNVSEQISVVKYKQNYKCDRFLRSMRWWINYAWDRGCRDAECEVAV